jgi:hypothetical protein
MDSNTTDEHREMDSDAISEAWPTKIVLHTYPKQVGVRPAPMDWGNPDSQLRGPVVVSRHKTTVRRRNSMLTILRIDR